MNNFQTKKNNTKHSLIFINLERTILVRGPSTEQNFSNFRGII